MWGPKTIKQKEPVLFTEFECQGNEPSLIDCSYKRIDECPSSNNVIISCFDPYYVPPKNASSNSTT